MAIVGVAEKSGLQEARVVEWVWDSVADRNVLSSVFIRTRDALTQPHHAAVAREEAGMREKVGAKESGQKGE